MKWIAFGIFAATIVPSMVLLGTTNKRWRSILFGILLASTVVGIDVNFYSLEHYRGPDRGFQIGLTDFIAASLGIAILTTSFRKVRWVPPNTIPMAAYFGIAAIATFNAPLFVVALFTLFKLFKGYLIYWAVYNYCRIEMSYRALWWGLIAICSVETFYALKQKYLFGFYRVQGTFDHSNTIPAYLLLIIPLLLTWALVERNWSKSKALATVSAMLGACFCIVGSLSRAGIAMAGIAILIVAAGNFARGISLRATVIIGVLGLLLIAGGVKSADTLVQRFVEAPESSGEARDEFNHAADLMTADKMFGIGLNCFSHVLTATPKYNQHISVMGTEEHAGVCHHIYRLTSAEMGQIGLGCFLLIMVRFLLIYFLALFNPASTQRALVFAILLGSCFLHAIGLLEWVFRVTPVMHLFLIMSAIGVALSEKAKQISNPSNEQQIPCTFNTTPAPKTSTKYSTERETT